MTEVLFSDPLMLRFSASANRTAIDLVHKMMYKNIDNVFLQLRLQLHFSLIHKLNVNSGTQQWLLAIARKNLNHLHQVKHTFNRLLF